jgi:hypothetical protein
VAREADALRLRLLPHPLGDVEHAEAHVAALVARDELDDAAEEGMRRVVAQPSKMFMASPSRKNCSVAISSSGSFSARSASNIISVPPSMSSGSSPMRSMKRR